MHTSIGDDTPIISVDAGRLAFGMTQTKIRVHSLTAGFFSWSDPTLQNRPV